MSDSDQRVPSALEESLINYGVFISFSIGSIRLHLSEDKTPSIAVSCSLAPALREYITNKNGESIRGIEWTARLMENAGYRDEPSDVFGTMQYFAATPASAYDGPEPASCHIECMLSPAVFGELVASLRSGNRPTDLAIRVRGPAYGNAPDGSHKVWDVKEVGLVIGMNVNIPVAPDQEIDPSDDGDPPLQKLTTVMLSKAQVDRIQSAIAEGAKNGAAAITRAVLWSAVIVALVSWFSR